MMEWLRGYLNTLLWQWRLSILINRAVWLGMMDKSDVMGRDRHSWVAPDKSVGIVYEQDSLGGLFIYEQGKRVLAARQTSYGYVVDTFRPARWCCLIWEAGKGLA